MRPVFNTTYDIEAQTVEVNVPKEYQHLVEGVFLRHAETLQNERRDFRWMIAMNNVTNKCIAPAVKMPKKNRCFQTIFWKQAKMEQQADDEGHYKIDVPQPQEGLWMGFYAQVYFKGEGPDPKAGMLKNSYHKTSMGWVTPDTLPFEPCEGQTCTSNLI
uniref:Uncharacterized protein n=1 Tax=Strombidium inclinatum TaxID=197538 RepID=A0A7S3MTC4_9SPIT|mmetsp:Transcript_17919/g.27718  ORF Transcript_17919/g.27718 Transcript_17919/m.27718 type:complete len:159 (+) Transcript_17919:172-648(+)